MDSKLGLCTPAWDAHAFLCSFLGFSRCQKNVLPQKTKGLCSFRRNIGDMLILIQIVLSSNTQIFDGLYLFES